MITANGLSIRVADVEFLITRIPKEQGGASKVDTLGSVGLIVIIVAAFE